MTETEEKDSYKEDRKQLSVKIEKVVQRKFKAQQRKKKHWYFLGVIGSVGWLIVVPTLIGAALGLWLDNHFPQKLSQTLALMLGGLAIGCFNAWRWVERERKSIEDEEHEGNG